MPKKKKKEGKKAIRKKLKTTWDEFRKFISRGSIIDLAVGVIIGGAFNAIVTSLVSILMSICTWGVPGGISGLVTVLPAANSAQAGVPGIGQAFAADGDTISAMVEIYANEFGLTGAMTTARSELLGKYTLHGDTYYYNGSALIDWGSFINAVISFLVIAITLFVGRILNVGTCFPDSHRRENIISCRAIVDRVVIVIDVQVRTSVVEIDNYDRNVILL